MSGGGFWGRPRPITLLFELESGDVEARIVGQTGVFGIQFGLEGGDRIG
jgi:hypothetical protein